MAWKKFHPLWCVRRSSIKHDLHWLVCVESSTENKIGGVRQACSNRSRKRSCGDNSSRFLIYDFYLQTYCHRSYMGQNTSSWSQHIFWGLVSAFNIADQWDVRFYSLLCLAASFHTVEAVLSEGATCCFSGHSRGEFYTRRRKSYSDRTLYSLPGGQFP